MDRVTRRAFVAAAGAGAAGVALAAALGSHKRPPPEVKGTIVAAQRGSPLPVDEPLSDSWLAADPVIVPVVPQAAVPPVLEEASVKELVVEALHDESELALRLGWGDTEIDDLDGILRFHDAVAVQLPAQAGAQPPITMGAAGQPVHILQWRASWQRDVDLGHQGVEILYPRVVHDEPPEKVLAPRDAELFYVARYLQNPIASAHRVSPVEEIVAEGFGSATALSDQRARGSAVHEDGRWSVTIGLPLDRGSAGARIDPGSTWPVAFAVWVGSKGNRGGRKHFADWKQLRLET